MEAQDRQHKPQERPKSAKIDSKSDLGPPASPQKQTKISPRPSTWDPRATQDRPQSPKSGQESPTEAQEWPRAAKNHPKNSQECPRARPRRPKTSPGRPRAAQNAPKAPQDDPEPAHGDVQDDPRRPQHGYRRPQRLPKGSKSHIIVSCCNMGVRGYSRIAQMDLRATLSHSVVICAFVACLALMPEIQ